MTINGMHTDTADLLNELRTCSPERVIVLWVEVLRRCAAVGIEHRHLARLAGVSEEFVSRLTWRSRNRNKTTIKRPKRTAKAVLRALDTLSSLLAYDEYCLVTHTVFVAVYAGSKSDL